MLYVTVTESKYPYAIDLREMLYAVTESKYPYAIDLRDVVCYSVRK